MKGYAAIPYFAGKPNTGEPFDSEALSALEGQGAPNVNHQKLGVLVKINICKSLHYTYEVSINAGSSKSLAQWKKLFQWMISGHLHFSINYASTILNDLLGDCIDFAFSSWNDDPSDR